MDREDCVVLFRGILQRCYIFLEFDDQEDMCRDISQTKILSYDSCILYSVSGQPQ